jgi:hypothetical protein
MDEFSSCPWPPFYYDAHMSDVEQIEDAVRRLSAEDRAAFRSWYADFDGEEWDRQLEADVSAGKLDWLVEEARSDKKAGRCTDR